MNGCGWHDELILGVGAANGGAGCHVADVDEAWRIRERGADIAGETGNGIGGWERS